jgi:hypothetical protein
VSERSELAVFRVLSTGTAVPDSHRARSRFESFLVSFFAEKKGKSVVNNGGIKVNKLNKLVDSNFYNDGKSNIICIGLHYFPLDFWM